LKVDQVGIHDNFFDLGGHSLAMADIFSRLQIALNKEISITDLFEYPTVSSLSRFLSRGSGKSSFQPGPGSADKAKAGVDRLRQQFRQRQQASRKGK
ncbi:MAG: phosphopantetheine-binding protein, partial [Blastocatellia bacterium]